MVNASWSSCEGMLQVLQLNAVAAKYPQRTITVTPTPELNLNSSHSGTGFDETYLAGQMNLDVYEWEVAPLLLFCETTLKTLIVLWQY